MALAFALGMSSCAVRQVSHIPPPQISAPALTASAADLVKDLNGWSAKVDTLEGVVRFHTSATFKRAGITKEYHVIRGYILLKKPSMIRIQGQAPVVRTEIFDMVSDGRQFRLSIPPKNLFLIGRDNYRGPRKPGLENLRPQHVLEALLIPPVEPTEEYFVEEDDRGGRSYYVLTVVKPGVDRALKLARKIWFDRADLRVARAEIYGAGGRLEEDVTYSNYGDFQGISYPSDIKLRRPEEGYRLSIQFQKIIFNEEISPEKFELPAPANAKIIQLNAVKLREAPSDR